ncbi:hypothetical protein F4778DRAFT_757228 [Xylariomycetidae sp. FL2044]|nr:hypothetical protein F4778DRAFT_757228 [Xylariomycetidae sp. FL2044]
MPISRPIRTFYHDIAAIITVPSSEPDVQRGRKRRRTPPDALRPTAAHTPTGESATFRGRCRHRSTSRFDLSRNPSRLSSLSPSRRRLLRVVQVNRHRSQSPSRSRSKNTQDSPKRRRQRTRSRSRAHQGESRQTHVAELMITSPLRHELVIKREEPSREKKQDG